MNTHPDQKKKALQALYKDNNIFHMCGGSKPSQTQLEMLWFIFDQHSDAIYEALSAEEDKWLPISEAPMDTWILAFDTDHCEVVRWIPQRRDEGLKSPRLWVDGVTIRSWLKPTHFQPLPAPPRNEGKE